MRKVVVTDEQGWLRPFWIRNYDKDTTFGIPENPPDLNRLDWDGIKREIHNELVNRGLSTWQDVQRQQDAITSIVLSVVRNKIIGLYKIKDMEVRNDKLNQSSENL